MNSTQEIRDVNKVHFFNLDVLRFIAAFMVLIFHGWLAYCGWFRIPTPLAAADGKTFSTAGTYVDTFIGNLDLGVEFFFLISGFLITYLLLQEKKSTDSLKIGKFYVRRALRIWPLYFLLIAVSPFWCRYLNVPLPDYSWPLTFTSNYGVIFTKQWQFPFEHFWSIGVEEHFYFVWPWLILLVPNKRMPFLFASVIFISIAFRVIISMASQEWYNHIFLNTVSRIDVMAIGAWVAWYHHNHPIEIKISRGIRILFYVTAIFIFCTDSNKNLGGGLLIISIKKYIYVMIFLFGFLNYTFNQDSFFNFKKKNFLHYLGKISFGIYIYHNVLFSFIVQKIMWAYQSSSFYIFWSIYVVIVIAISVLSYELIEKHILKFKDKFALIKTTR